MDQLQRQFLYGQGWPAGDKKCMFMPASQSETEVQKAGMVSLVSCGKNLNPGQTVLELCTPCWWLAADNTRSLSFFQGDAVPSWDSLES